MQNTSMRYVLWGATIIIGLALVYFGFKYVMYLQTVRDLPAVGTEVVFFEGGIGERYVMDNKQLLRTLDTSRADGVVIYEHAPYEGGSVVLASVPEIEGLALGRIGADQSFTLLATGATNKAELSVAGNLAVFSAVPAVPETTEVSDADAPESEVEQTYTDPNPTAPDSVPAVTLATELVAVDLTTGAIAALGAGRSPRVMDDGTVLALGLEGLVRIDPKTQVRTRIIPAPTPHVVNGGISPSGNLAALPGPDNALIKFYRLTRQGAEEIGFLDRETGGPIRLVFVDDERFFLRTGTATAWLYKMPTERLPIASPFAILPIIQ